MEQQLFSGEKELPKNRIFLNLNRKTIRRKRNEKDFEKCNGGIACITVASQCLWCCNCQFADDAETVDVTVNKRIWTDESAPSEILNTGAQMDFGGEALNGVTFARAFLSDVTGMLTMIYLVTTQNMLSLLIPLRRI